MSDAACMRKPIKDQTPSFGRAGVESHRTTTTTTYSWKPQSDSEKMRKPIKDQTPSFGKAGVESHWTTTTVSSSKPQSDSEKIEKPIKNQTPSFVRAGIESHRIEPSSGACSKKAQTDSKRWRSQLGRMHQALPKIMQDK